MLKNIRLHIEKDEKKQEALEQSLAQHIKKTFESNINKLQRTIPSLLPYTGSDSRQNISVFCNKYGEYNLVDYGTGRVVYGLHPYSEVMSQVTAFRRHSSYIRFDNTSTQTKTKSKTSSIKFQSELLDALPHLQKRASFHSLPTEIECLVVLGCGLGMHIEELIKSVKIKHLILYEAEAQFFGSSVLVTDWNSILRIAAENDTSLYVQIGNDGRDIISDITELRQHFDLNGFYLYKHFNQSSYDSVFEQLTTKSWSTLVYSGLSFQTKERSNSYCPLWTHSNQLQRYTLADHKQSDRFKKNTKAFKHFYPDIAKQFENYSPKTWLPICLADGQINLIEKHKLASLYSDSPRKDCNKIVKDFEKHPNRDGLTLGYSGEKLLHYGHYSFVKQIDTVLESHQEKQESLPTEIQSIIVFGLGAGYPLETLCDKHQIENLFLCEPNLDFFYGSLFAIDWHTILKKIDSSGARLYINVGDDGSNLFRDLLAQFYSIGPYILNNTYFLQSYYNEHLNQAVAQLREQLQVVISMGEYFDHAYYGINHTLEGIKRNYPILRKSPAKYLDYDSKDVPIFVIGSGPSIDTAIKTIKESSDLCIVVSCGTALKVLHKHGITPDFHAEIEQNRASFEWCSLIDEPDYLKSISLISCNGIHPDTCNLFKDVFVVFKDGESSTISTLNVFGEEKAEVIQYAFPTVANFTANLYSVLGFRNIYLLGIDLGFIDKKKHHSASTGYYQDGKEIGDYSTKYNTSVVIEGNFRPTVLTKPEFKLSKQIIEHTISNTDKDVMFFNCSDGAKIAGATPLTAENILITNSAAQKRAAVLDIKNQGFLTDLNDIFFDAYEKRYSKQTLASDLDNYQIELDNPIRKNGDVLKLIETLKTTMFDSYQKGDSLFFYYFYGTINYANAAFSKLIDYKKPNKKMSKDLAKALDIWRDSFARLSNLVQQDLRLFDATTVQKYGQRARKTFINKLKDASILIVTDSKAFYQSMKWSAYEHLNLNVSMTISSYSKLHEIKDKRFDYVVYDCYTRNKNINGILNSANFGRLNSVFVADVSIIEAKTIIENYSDATILPLLGLKPKSKLKSIICNHHTIAHIALLTCLEQLKNQIILLKHIVLSNANEVVVEINNETPTLIDMTSIITDYHDYCTILSSKSSHIDQITNSETRGKPVASASTISQIMQNVCEEKAFLDILATHEKRIPTLFNDETYLGIEVFQFE